MVPSKSVPKMPREMWCGQKPSIKHLHGWGCTAYVLNSQATKLEARSEERHFIGYPKGTRGWLFYHLDEQKVITSVNARFLEDEFHIHAEKSSGVSLEEVSPDS